MKIFYIFWIIDFLGDTCLDQLKNLVGHAFGVEAPFMARCLSLFLGQLLCSFWEKKNSACVKLVAYERVGH